MANAKISSRQYRLRHQEEDGERQALKYIRQRGAKYTNALKQGAVESAYACVMFIGPGGVGKSSFLCGLMNKPLPVGDSTQLAQSTTVKVSSQNWASAGEVPDAFWIELTDKDELMEFVGMVHLAVEKSTDEPAVELLSTIQADEPAFSDLKKIRQRKVAHKAISEALIMAKGFEFVPIPKFEILLRTWDCGGQTVFLEVLPAFLTRRTMFLLMYDARRKLTDTCVNRSYKGGEIVSEYHHKISTQEILLEWMACIHAMLGKNRTKDDNVPTFPRIMTVGTHGDYPEVNANKEQIVASINSACQQKAFIHLLKKNVVIDNTTAGQGDREDPVYKQVRREISSFTKKELAVPTPISWVLYRRVFQKVAKETYSPTISYEVALDIGRACHISVDEIPSVLQFYHDLAVFFHYSDLPSLKDYIIANPQWLIDQFAKILAPKGFECVSIPPLWDLLRNRGILVQPLYEEVWKESEIPSQSLVDLLVHFLLASPLSDVSKVIPYITGKKYFVSCVLPASSKSEIMKNGVLTSAPLHMRFTTHYVPPGFFSRLITTLANEQKCKVVFTVGVYCDRITILYGDPSNMIDEVTISKSASSVQFTVVRTTLRPSQCSPFSIACLEILHIIDKCTRAVLEWLPGIEVSYAFLCDHCQKKQTSDQHFIPVPTNSTTQSVLRCEKLQFPELTRHHQHWLMVSEDEQLRMCESSELGVNDLSQLAQIVESRGKLEELAEVLEASVHLKSLQGSPDAGYETLLAWSADMQKHGINIRSHMIHHLKMIGVTDVATKLSLGRAVIPSAASSPMPFVKSTAVERQTVLKQNDIGVLLRELTPVVSDWEDIGVYLSIDEGTLSAIKKDEQTVRGRLREMLRAWLRRVDPPPTWTAMIEVVELIDEARARELRSKYCSNQ